MGDYTVARREHKAFVNDLRIFSAGLDVDLIERIIAYAECLVSLETSEISEPVYILEMAKRFNLTNQMILNLIFKGFKTTYSNQKGITLKNYCKLICIFLSPDMDKQIDFVFRVYDIDLDDHLSRIEVMTLLRPTIRYTTEDREEMVKDLTDMLMKVVDTDGNGNVDQQEFRDLVKEKNVLYMEMLGKCLPDETDIEKFKHKLLSRSVLQVKDYFVAEDYDGMFGNIKPMAIKNEYYPIPLEF